MSEKNNDRETEKGKKKERKTKLEPWYLQLIRKYNYFSNIYLSSLKMCKYELFFLFFLIQIFFFLLQKFNWHQLFSISFEKTQFFVPFKQPGEKYFPSFSFTNEIEFFLSGNFLNLFNNFCAFVFWIKWIYSIQKANCRLKWSNERNVRNARRVWWKRKKMVSMKCVEMFGLSKNERGKSRIWTMHNNRPETIPRLRPFHRWIYRLSSRKGNANVSTSLTTIVSSIVLNRRADICRAIATNSSLFLWLSDNRLKSTLSNSKLLLTRDQRISNCSSINRERLISTRRSQTRASRI